MTYTYVYGLGEVGVQQTGLYHTAPIITAITIAKLFPQHVKRKQNVSKWWEACLQRVWGAFWQDLNFVPSYLLIHSLQKQLKNRKKPSAHCSYK